MPIEILSDSGALYLASSNGPQDSIAIILTTSYMVNPYIGRETSKLARQTKNIEILFKKSQALTLEHDSALKDLNFYESVKLIFL